uniref:RNA-directed RNA polymerase n=1 Tax=Riboviria sp. TaxID=2585031 RepID=A0A6M3YNL1_9VIRU|nr:MAG: RNA-dependent RNA polymerase [Riboviria sp.]
MGGEDPSIAAHARRTQVCAPRAKLVFSGWQDWEQRRLLPGPPAREAHCMLGCPMASVDPRHKILKNSPDSHDARTRSYLVGAHPFMYQVTTHSSCVCNEKVALTNRHLVDRTDIPFDKKLWREVARETKRFYPKGLAPISYEQVYEGYTGVRKRRYRQAAVILRTEGLQPKHATVRMFVKPDRHPVGDIGGKDPRAIQYRSPEFNVALSAYIKPFEDSIYPSVNYGVVSGTRVIVKGMNNRQRAELLLHKIDSFRRPKFVLLDHSRFDSTINMEHLKTTHSKYQRAFQSRSLAGLLRKQLHNKGWTKHGIKYRTTATRMSGDPDTACGNSVVNADCLFGAITRSGITKYDFILDGDDSVVILEEEDNIDHTIFGRLGFKTKMEVVHYLEDVEFCQSKIILTTPPTFSRNPSRAMSNSMVALKKYPRRTVSKWVAAVGECERATNIGVPVLQAYGTQLAAMDKEWFVDPDIAYRWNEGQHDAKNKPITEDARASFAMAWGVPVEIQLLMEQYPYTSNVYCSRRRKIGNFQHEQSWLARRVSRIAASVKSTAEFGGCGWWSCSQAGPECPGVRAPKLVAAAVWRGPAAPEETCSPIECCTFATGFACATPKAETPRAGAWARAWSAFCGRGWGRAGGCDGQRVDRRSRRLNRRGDEPWS